MHTLNVFFAYNESLKAIVKKHATANWHIIFLEIQYAHIHIYVQSYIHTFPNIMGNIGSNCMLFLQQG